MTCLLSSEKEEGDVQTRLIEWFCRVFGLVSLKKQDNARHGMVDLENNTLAMARSQNNTGNSQGPPFHCFHDGGKPGNDGSK